MKRTILAAATLAAAATLVLAPTASAEDWWSSGSASVLPNPFAPPPPPAPAPPPPPPAPAPAPPVYHYPVARYVACSDASTGTISYTDGNGDYPEFWTTLTYQGNGLYCGYLDVTIYDSYTANHLIGSFDASEYSYYSDYTSFAIYLDGVKQCFDSNDFGFAYCSNY